jgi:hypothetical protein
MTAGTGKPLRCRVIYMAACRACVARPRSSWPFAASRRHVRNRPDGTVELEAEGQPAEVEHSAAVAQEFRLYPQRGSPAPARATKTDSTSLLSRDAANIRGVCRDAARLLGSPVPANEPGPGRLAPVNRSPTAISTRQRWQAAHAGHQHPAQVRHSRRPPRPQPRRRDPATKLMASYGVGLPAAIPVSPSVTAVGYTRSTGPRMKISCAGSRR